MTTVEARRGPAAPPGGRGFDLTALSALFVLTLRQHLRGTRFMVLSLLFLLPAGIAVLAKLVPNSPPPIKLEFLLVYHLIPHALATLTALVYAAGIIQDEVEAQTLTYLLLRPLPRWALYLTKLAATILVTSAMTTVFTLLTYGVLYWGAEDFATVLGGRALKTVAILALAQAAYCSLFGAFSFFTRWAVVVGIGYIAGFEGGLANIPMVIRQLTVMYYFRVLVVRWAGLPVQGEWNIDLEKTPTAGACMWTLLGICAAFAALGAIMMRREFRMKTPGG